MFIPGLVRLSQISTNRTIAPLSYFTRKKRIADKARDEHPPLHSHVTRKMRIAEKARDEHPPLRSYSTRKVRIADKARDEHPPLRSCATRKGSTGYPLQIAPQKL